jgi:voltage-gated potassium channel
MSKKEREQLLTQLDENTDTLFNVLSIIWLFLVGIDYLYGFTKTLEVIFYTIWAFFIIHFLIEISLATDKKKYLKDNFLTLISLFIPTIRILRVFRAFRILRFAKALRSVSLIQVLTSLNRSMRTLRYILGSPGIGYITTLTIFVEFIGAAAIYHFENPVFLRENGYTPNSDLRIGSYGDALWFTSMLLVTIGSDYWPKSTEGRVLTFIISLYAFAVFGYITATIASFILGNKKS